MKNTLLRIFAAAGLALALAAPAQADFNDGVVAYLMGDYETSFNTMRSLADTADHAYAQYYLGMMYLNGQGVAQSYEDASTWFRKAAEHGIPQAQFKLGTLYTSGQGVPRDFEYAYAWYATAAAQNHKKSVEALPEAKSRLSPEELREADKLAEKFIRTYRPEDDKADPNQPRQVPAE